MSRKQLIWAIALFIISLIIFSISNIPARQVMRLVELPANIQIKGLNGSITNGNVEALRFQQFTLTDVDFNFQPLCLVKLSICYQLTSDDKNLKLNLETNLITQNSSISDSQIAIDATLFKDIPQMLVQPKGEMLVTIQSMALVDSKINGLNATLDWPGAGIEGADQILGNYYASIVQQKDNLIVKLDDKDSLLSIKGDIDIKLNGQVDMKLKFETKPDLNKSVTSVLEMTTKKSGLNKYTLKKTGRLPANNLKYLKVFNAQN